MASRVNVKFVVILCAGAVLLLGGMAGAYVVFAMKSGEDHIRLGDEAMAEAMTLLEQRDQAITAGQDATELNNTAQTRLEAARNHYSKAVNHDPSRVDWMEKWLGAIKQWTPTTQTIYATEFQAKYMAVLGTIARTQRTNVDAHIAFIDVLYELNSALPYQRGGYEGIAYQVDEALGYFDTSTEGDWMRLLRYRGLAMERVLQAPGSTLTDEEIAQIGEDLRGALRGDPNDSLAAVSLSRWEYRRVARDTLATPEAIEEARDAAMAVLDEHLARNPGDARVELQRLSLRLERELSTRLESVVDGAARSALAREILEDARQEFDRVAALVSGMTPERVDLGIVAQMERLERNIDPQGQYRRVRAELRRLLEARPDDARLLLAAAQIEGDNNLLDEAIGKLARIDELRPLPLSLRGWLRQNIQNLALALRGRYEIQRISQLETDEERDAQLEVAKSIRGQLADVVDAESPRLRYLDALIAQVENRPRDALRLFTQYNQETDSGDFRGLWGEAFMADVLGQTGVARTRYEQVLAARAQHLPARRRLAALELRLGNLERARELYANIAEAIPDDEVALEQLRRIEAALDPTSDSLRGVEAVVLAARTLARGTESEPGNPDAALQLLMRKFESLDDDEVRHDPSIAREIAQLHIDRDDLGAARAVLATSLAANPDDARLAEIHGALQTDRIDDALMTLIDQQFADPYPRALRKFQVFSARGVRAYADQAFDELVRIAPDEPEVLDIRFVRAIRAEDFGEAEAIADIAGAKNADQVGGLTFRARLQSINGDHVSAIETLRAAVARFPSNGVVQRMLATELVMAERYTDAIEAYERALDVKPDDIRTIREYVEVLIRAGQADRALVAARTYQRYARNDPFFTDRLVSLEASEGGRTGLTSAIRRRLSLAKTMTDPAVRRDNEVKLAGLYIQAAADEVPIDVETAPEVGEALALLIERGQPARDYWDLARALIDRLTEERYDLDVVEVDARWHADQGQLVIDGQTTEGVEAAMGVYARYIVSLPEGELTDAPYLSLAMFAQRRGRVGNALAALNEARQYQNAATLDVDKRLADLYYLRGEVDRARQLYQSIVDAGADTESEAFRQRLIDTMLRRGDFEAAEQELAKQAPAVAQGFEAMLQKAEAAAGRGDASGASLLLDEAVAAHSNNSLVYVRRAQHKLRDPRMRIDALADLESALRLNADDWQALTTRGQVYWNEGRFNDATRDWTRSLLIRPDGQGEVFLRMLFFYLNEGRTRDAVALTRDLTDAFAGRVDFATTAAGVFSERELMSEAARFYAVAFDRSRQPAIAVQYIDALCRSAQPDTVQARAVIRSLEAIGIDAATNEALATAMAQIFLAENRRDQADQWVEQSLDTLLRVGQGNPGLLNRRLANLVSWGQAIGRIYGDDAPALVERLLGARTLDEQTSPWAQFVIAQRYMQADQYSQAIGVIEPLTEHENGAVQLSAFQTLGALYTTTDRVDEGLAVWRRGLERFANDWQLHNNVAYTLASQKGDPSGALDHAVEAATLAPNAFDAQDTLAYVYLKLGKADEAFEALRRSGMLVNTTRGQITLGLNRARLALLQNEIDEARRLLETVRVIVGPAGGLRERYGSDIDALGTQIDSAG